MKGNLSLLKNQENMQPAYLGLHFLMQGQLIFL